jgi:hypothetical protein
MMPQSGVPRNHAAHRQKQRSVGTAPPAIEPQPRRLRGMKHLPMLREALQRESGITSRQAAA